MGMRAIGGFFLKSTIIATGFSLIIFENQLRTYGFDSVVEKGLGVVRQVQVALKPVLGAADQGPVAVDTSGQSAASLSAAVGLPETPVLTPSSQGEGLTLAATTSLTEASAPPLGTSICDQGGSRSSGTVPGDIIQVRYFQKSAVDFDQGGSSSSAEIVFERLDLSGTFTVGMDGDLSLPAVGHIDVLGRNLACIEALVARAAFDRLRINSAVSANFLSRPQISLQGAVRSPGTYVFTPGLTVARLLAQAGSIGQDDPASRMRRIELLAHASELQRSANGLSLLRQRVETALSGDDTLDFAPVDMPGTGAGLTEELIGAERMALHAERDAIRSLRGKQQAELRALDLRIGSAERQLDAITGQHAYFSERVAHLTGLRKKGITTFDTLVASEIKLMDAEYVMLEKAQLVRELKSQRDVLQRSFEVAAAEARKSKVDALRDLIASQEAIDGQMATVVAQLENTAGDSYRTVVTIERTGPDGTVRIETTAATEILPGDFVTVVAKADNSAPFDMRQSHDDTDPGSQKMVMK